jgi:hypothetical protein
MRRRASWRGAFAVGRWRVGHAARILPGEAGARHDHRYGLHPGNGGSFSEVSRRLALTASSRTARSAAAAIAGVAGADRRSGVRAPLPTRPCRRDLVWRFLARRQLTAGLLVRYLSSINGPRRPFGEQRLDAEPPRHRAERLRSHMLRPRMRLDKHHPHMPPRSRTVRVP